MTQDPFAAAQVDTPATPDPFTSASQMDDPFAVSSDSTGDFTPAVPLENLQGRLVVMVPRSLDPNAKDPNDPAGQKTREQYTVDLYVLDGGRLSYWFKQRANPEKGTPEEMKEMVIETISPEDPAVWPNYWVPQQGLIGKLKHAHANGRPFLGVVSMVPTAADRRNGKTASQVQAEVGAWISRNRQGSRPRYTWALEDPTPAQRQTAIAWWGRERGNIAAIVPAS